MDAKRWNAVKTLFGELIKLPPDERIARAHERAGQSGFDQAMLAELVDLLACDDPTLTVAERDARFDLGSAMPDLVQIAGEEVARSNRDARLGSLIGCWRLLSLLGSGGMGAVYLVERSDQDFHQYGALKLIQPGSGGSQAGERFRSERRILATLEHPGIARLLDGGESEDGDPYIVMEYVEGQRIDRYADTQDLGLEQRLALFLEVCEAVTAAHRQLIVHRDLKPSNILVDATGRPRLLDFGIAKLVEPGIHAATTSTRVFTPEYAAPEQVRGEPVTTSVDVYALGLLLFQLLTGTRPWARTASTPFAYEQAILNQTPTQPSRALDEPGAQRTAAAMGLSVARLGLKLKGDLDEIVLKALRKEPEARYRSVEALAEDVRNYLERRPVLARRGSRRYRLGRFVARHRLPLALTTALLGVLLTGLVALALQAQQVRAERDQAIVERERADAMVAFQREIFRQANPNRHQGQEPTASELLDIGERLIDQRDDLPRATRAALLYEMANSRFDLAGFDAAAGMADRARELYFLEGDINGVWLSGILSAKSAFNVGRPADAEAILVSLEAGDWAGQVAAGTRAEALYLRGLIHGNRGERERAVALLRESAALFATTGEGFQRHVIKALRPAAFYLGSDGRHEEAMQLFADLQALVGSGPLEPVIAHAMASAETLLHQLARRWAEAREPAERQLRLAEEIFGPDSDDASFAYAQMGAITMASGDYQASRDWYQRTYEIRRQTSGPTSTGTLFAVRELARVDLYYGDFDELDRKTERVIEGYLAMYDDTNPNLLFTRALVWIGMESKGQGEAAARAAASVKTGAPEAFAAMRADYRYRLEAIMLAYASPTPDCAGLLALADSRPDNVPSLLAELYYIDCLRRLGTNAEAELFVRRLDPAQLARHHTDPALRMLRDNALALLNQADSDG